MTKIELLDYKARAIIGDIRNMSLDCLERPRPRVQYMHFWRGIKRKLLEVVNERDLLSTELGTKLTGLRGILDRWEKPQNINSRDISKECLDYLGITYIENNGSEGI